MGNRLKHTRKLGRLVEIMSMGGVHNHETYLAWRKDNEDVIAKALEYNQRKNMPKASTLLQLAFWPNEALPLVMFNYAKSAPVLLLDHPDGWTPVLKQCRGIIFELGTGRLISLPMEKFFNYGEVSCQSLPEDIPYVAPQKLDGHMVSIFEYRQRYYTSTRGYFDSPTSILAQELLDPHAEAYNWAFKFNPDWNIVTELIHPQTHVGVDYGDRQEFMVLAIHNRKTGEEFWYHDLFGIAAQLGLNVVELGPEMSLPELLEHVKNLNIKNQEGYVLWYVNGLRVKIKFYAYLGGMFAKKLNLTYVMTHIVEDDMDDRLKMMETKDRQRALAMIRQIMDIANDREKTPAERWRELYALLPDKLNTDYHRGICRKFIKSMDAASEQPA